MVLGRPWMPLGVGLKGRVNAHSLVQLDTKLGLCEFLPSQMPPTGTDQKVDPEFKSWHDPLEEVLSAKIS